MRPVNPGEEFRVVRANVASGEFTVTGAEQFVQVIQDGLGVLCLR